MKLAELQDFFQQGLLQNIAEEGGGVSSLAILAEVNTSEKEEKDVLFGVYQTAYILRLIEFLQGDYEHLETYLGDEGFDEMARAYIQTHPSVFYNARWFGAKLPEFLTRTKPWSTHQQLAELAAFDLALMNSFDAANAQLFTASEMAQVEDFAELVLLPHPATSRLDLLVNTAVIREALIADKEPPEAAPLDEPQKWLFYRSDDLQSMYRLLSYEEAMMWDEMARGVNFAGLCEILAHYSNEDEAPGRAAGYLQNWMSAGLLRV